MSLNSHGNALAEGYRLHWYRVGRVLGKGGFGITYEALDTNLDKPVAIKEYLPMEYAVREQNSTVRPFTEDRKAMFEWGLDRFLQEARTLAKFRHPNIVLVHNVFEENGTAYMVMEYEHGEALDRLFKMGRLENEKELLPIAHALLDGLDHMHEAGFIHRDIKPPNIYIRLDGTPVLLDFGSARFAIGGDDKTLTSLVSPGFAPYEQYHSESGNQGPWTDIYGLGATLYAGMNRGRGPLDAIVRGNARIEGKPDPMESATELGKGRYSTTFLNAVDAALGFTPKERPQTVTEWRKLFPTLEDFSAVSKTKPLSEADIPTVIHGVEQVSTKPQQHGVAKWLMIGLAVAGIAGGIYLIKPWQTSMTPTIDQQQNTGAELQQVRQETSQVEARLKLLEEQARLAQEAQDKKQKEQQERLAIQMAEEHKKLEEERAQLEKSKTAYQLQQAKNEAEKTRAAKDAQRLKEERSRLADEEAKRRAKKDATTQLALEKKLQERRNHINQLLIQATQDIAEGRLSDVGNTQGALSRYKEILVLDPKNKSALEGISRLTAMMASQRQSTTQTGAIYEGVLPIALVHYGETPRKSADYVSGKLKDVFIKSLKKMSINNEIELTASVIDSGFFAGKQYREKYLALCKKNSVSMILGIYFDHFMGGQSGELIVTAYDCTTNEYTKKPYHVEFDSVARKWGKSWRKAITSFITDTGIFNNTRKTYKRI